MDDYVTSAARRPRALVMRGLIAGTMVAAVVLAGTRTAAQNELISREYAIKAGIIGLLGKCVTWPADTAPSEGQPLSIGILGNDPFFENGMNQLDRAVTEQNLKGGNIVVKRFHSIHDYEPCHILFVSNPSAEANSVSVSDRIKAVREIAGGETVLIVGESTGVTRLGATANLLFDRTTNLIRLEINPDAAARAGLKLSPDLLRLKLVTIVRDSTARM